MKIIVSIVCSLLIALAVSPIIHPEGKTTDKVQACSKPSQEIISPTFRYDLSTRAKHTVTKEQINKATTVADLMPDYAIQKGLKDRILAVRDVKVITEDEKETSASGRYALTDEQLKILKSFDYSTNFFLEGYSIQNELIPDVNKERYFKYFMTVVPEKQAVYKEGKEALIEYLKSSAQAIIDKQEQGSLKSGNILLTISPSGILDKVELSRTCGYTSVDNRMLELFNQLPKGWWEAAANEKGENVEQTLIFTFGLLGC